MTWWFSQIGFLLAQNDGAGGAAAAPAGEPGASWLPDPTFMLVILVVMFYFMILRPQMREKNEHRKMLAALKTHDRVITTGGIYGTVASVHKDGDEVVLKIDESNNTKIRILRSSIARVLVEEKEKAANESAT